MGTARPLAALLAALLVTACSGHHLAKRFDAVAWRAQDDAHPVRDAMVDDLVRSGRLKGMTRAQVVDLLGEPTPTDKFRDYDMVYWLGPDRTYTPIDSSWLVITLADGRVKDDQRIED
jgi:outer membrane protein assembly factor BamE (lipoprotein component of BamABCDE complex)